MDPQGKLRVALGLVIATRRTTLGWSQQALALRAGVTVAWLGKLERGDTGMVSLETLTKVSDELGVLPEVVIAEARSRIGEVSRAGARLVRPSIARGRRREQP
jgi:transcriptional regulator with XRE-family HTH domain